ncbi:unnamed protein product [Polarella glacialis]|uniref:Isopenicillin N synthase-like Fe(2+) 2OG dioxygenase domain-containing protein n=1 Tax=Polarella glacialis TaxID=89957 RepID=A0A813JMM0_POLGL|nr:unnamed protein product [Polarella glacialis]
MLLDGEAAATWGRIKTLADTGLKSFFDQLAKDPDLVDRINATYPKKIVKHIGFENLAQDAASEGQKLTVDLNRKKLANIKELLDDMCPSFLHEVQEFMTLTEEELVPRELQRLSECIGSDLTSHHRQNNIDYRFLDYPSHFGSATRCAAHKDTSTLTIIIPDAVPGLETMSRVSEEPDAPCKWVSAPGGEVTALHGIMVQIMSNDKLAATEHRVVDAPAVNGLVPGRTCIAVFVDPDPDTNISPRVPPGTISRYQVVVSPKGLKTMLNQQATSGEEGKKATQDEIVARVRIPQGCLTPREVFCDSGPRDKGEYEYRLEACRCCTGCQKRKGETARESERLSGRNPPKATQCQESTSLGWKRSWTPEKLPCPLKLSGLSRDADTGSDAEIP